MNKHATKAELKFLTHPVYMLEVKVGESSTFMYSDSRNMIDVMKDTLDALYDKYKTAEEFTKTLSPTLAHTGNAQEITAELVTRLAKYTL